MNLYGVSEGNVGNVGKTCVLVVRIVRIIVVVVVVAIFLRYHTYMISMSLIQFCYTYYTDQSLRLFLSLRTSGSGLLIRFFNSSLCFFSHFVI